MTTYSSRQFDHDTSGAKRATKDGPVFITDHGRPAHVLLSIEDYRRLSTSRGRNALDAIADPNPEADFEFEFPEFKRGFSLKPPKFD